MAGHQEPCTKRSQNPGSPFARPRDPRTPLTQHLLAELSCRALFRVRETEERAENYCFPPRSMPPLSGRCSFCSWNFSGLRSFSCFLFLVLFLFGHGARAQPPPPQPVTDPLEVQALDSLFARWTISSGMSLVRWNITGDPCSGAAVNSSISTDDKYFNPAIKCNCTFNNGTTCHIIEVKVQKPKMVGGPLPDDIKKLTKLSALKLQGNFINGTVPPYIWNLSTLNQLNLSSNLLSGIIPGEIGKLQDLISLDLSMNNFSGPLPEELGNLANLQHLHLHSLGPGVNGSIPNGLSKLKNLKTMLISDNNFTGNIPNFIGSFVELKDLRLQGNSFQGPIPQTFSTLTNLTQLRIGEILNGSSGLKFIENMTSLVILILRNSNINGSFPSKMENFTILEHLDLSFNQLSGSIPQAIFNLPKLEYLFLGNNHFSGSLPERKNDKLVNIDLSYNNLSGTIPPWATGKSTDLQLNLVANNFTNLDESVFPRLKCLQRDYPCHPDSSFTEFSINCGGSQEVKVPEKAVYEIDNGNLSTASYSVSKTTNTMWGVSSVGRYLGVLYPSYTQAILSRFTNAPNSELYQGWRLSPSSLRYYGLGLINGNYTVYLNFAETLDWDTRKGRRFFDIYIQGIRVEKDFDITKEARGTSLFAIEKRYIANVTNQVLEIHLFWAGKGTCCVPNEGVYGPSISGISVKPNFDPSGNSSIKKGKHLRLIVGILVPTLALCCIIISVIVLRWKKQKLDLDDDEELMDLTLKQHAFSYAELKNATEDFNLGNKLGEGGSGIVYKGKLSDGRSVAVKQLFISSTQGRKQFATEVATITAVQHRNLVKLYGCCYEGRRRLLVYEYLANRSLDQVLLGKTLHLDWPTRFGICLGTARGLAYLHEESSLRIVHRDVKASNILLDTDLNPKIADFGLAKLYDKSKTHITTGVAGTVGYLAPEYAMRGQLTEKADVFAFGVVALEVLCGRRNTEPELGPERMYLLEWAWHLHAANNDLAMVDPILTTYNKDEALRVISVAFMCTQASPTKRPTMSGVVSMLIGDMKVSEVVSKPSYLMGWWAAEVDDSSFLSSTLSEQNSAAWTSAPSIKPTHTIAGGR